MCLKYDYDNVIITSNEEYSISYIAEEIKSYFTDISLVYNTQYTDMGIPKEVPKKGDNMSESDYKNLRKML